MTAAMLGTIGLVIIGQIVYQIGQRAIPADASPMIVLALAYFSAGILCILFAAPQGAFTSGTSLRSALSWPTALLTLSIAAIEFGYLLAYRNGWTLATAFPSASAVTIFALATIGWVAHGESLSTRQIVGLLCSSAAPFLLLSR